MKYPGDKKLRLQKYTTYKLNLFILIDQIPRGINNYIVKICLQTYTSIQQVDFKIFFYHECWLYALKIFLFETMQLWPELAMALKVRLIALIYMLCSSRPTCLVNDEYIGFYISTFSTLR